MLSGVGAAGREVEPRMGCALWWVIGSLRLQTLSFLNTAFPFGQSDGINLRRTKAIFVP